MRSTSERTAPSSAAGSDLLPRRDASMSLLADAISGALDPSYADARARADRRAERAAQQAAAAPAAVASGPGRDLLAGPVGEPVSRPRRRATRPVGPPQAARVVGAPADETPVRAADVQVLETSDEPAVWRVAPWVVLALLGVVTGLAVAQVRTSDSGATRGELLQDVRQQTRQADGMEGQAAALRAELAATRERVLATQADQRAVALALSAARAGAATSALSGPGLVVTLSDAPGSSGAGSSRGGQLASDRVFDSDLQAVTNALWASGARAITVNGLRLTAQTAIRSAGEAVLVDFRPLSSPYVVRALGDPGRLQSLFADDPAAVRLTSVSQQYGLGFTTERAARLTVPAGTPVPLRHATAPPAGGGGS